MAPPGARQMRRAYGFDEVAIVPGDVTINPELTDISFSLGEVKLRLPFLAAGMDAVVCERPCEQYAMLTKWVASSGIAHPDTALHHRALYAQMEPDPGRMHPWQLWRILQ